MLTEISKEDFELASVSKPLAKLGESDARRALSKAIAGCDVGAARRLLSAGLMIPKAQLQIINVPERCESRQLIEELLQL